MQCGLWGRVANLSDSGPTTADSCCMSCRSLNAASLGGEQARASPGLRARTHDTVCGGGKTLSQFINSHISVNSRIIRMSRGGPETAADGVCTPSPSQALSEGILSMVTPMVDKCDDAIQKALDSQADLSQQIDRVAGELQTFLSASQLPSFAPHVERLALVRRRAAAANNALATIQARLSRIEAMADQLGSEQNLRLQLPVTPSQSFEQPGARPQS